MTEKNLEKVFRDSLGQYEADVPSNLWQSVQSGLAAKAGAGASAAGSGAGKAAGILGTKGALWIAGAAIVAAGSIYMVINQQENKQQQPVAAVVETVTLADPPPIEDQEMPPMPESASDKVAATPLVKITEPSNAPVKQDPVQANQPKADQLTQSSQLAVQASPPVSEPRKELTQPATKAPEIQAPKQEEPAPNLSKETATTEAGPKFAAIENYLVPDQRGNAKLPNNFTPNGDGYNDEFTVLTQGLQSLEVTIFNHAGTVVCKWNDLNGKWNGRLPNGLAAPAGTYTYSVVGITPEGKLCMAQSKLILSEN